MQIDKNIPIPKRTGVTQILKSLSIGDSFLWNGKASQLYQPARNISIKITTSVEGHGVRVWRVE